MRFTASPQFPWRCIVMGKCGYSALNSLPRRKCNGWPISVVFFCHESPHKHSWTFNSWPQDVWRVSLKDCSLMNNWLHFPWTFWVHWTLRVRFDCTSLTDVFNVLQQYSAVPHRLVVGDLESIHARVGYLTNHEKDVLFVIECVSCYASSISICSIQRSLFTSIHIRQQYNSSTNLTEPFTVIACVLVQVLRKWSSTVWTSLPDPRQHKHWSGEVLPIPPQRRAECFHQFAASWSSTWEPRFILVCILGKYYIDIDITD